jgi:hypothetical protein
VRGTGVDARDLRRTPAGVGQHHAARIRRQDGLAQRAVAVRDARRLRDRHRLRGCASTGCQATSRTAPLTASSFDPRLLISWLSLRGSRWPGRPRQRGAVLQGDVDATLARIGEPLDAVACPIERP